MTASIRSHTSGHAYTYAQLLFDRCADAQVLEENKFKNVLEQEAALDQADPRRRECASKKACFEYGLPKRPKKIHAETL